MVYTKNKHEQEKNLDRFLLVRADGYRGNSLLRRSVCFRRAVGSDTMGIGESSVSERALRVSMGVALLDREADMWL